MFLNLLDGFVTSLGTFDGLKLVRELDGLANAELRRRMRICIFVSMSACIHLAVCSICARVHLNMWHRVRPLRHISWTANNHIRPKHCIQCSVAMTDLSEEIAPGAVDATVLVHHHRVVGRSHCVSDYHLVFLQDQVSLVMVQGGCHLLLAQ